MRVDLRSRAGCRDSDPSIRKQYPRKVFRKGDRAHGEGCREDAMSRRTISRRDAGAGVAGEGRACRIVRGLVTNSHKKSAETSLGAADTSVRATFIGPAKLQNVETPGTGFSLWVLLAEWAVVFSILLGLPRA